MSENCSFYSITKPSQEESTEQIGPPSLPPPPLQQWATLWPAPATSQWTAESPPLASLASSNAELPRMGGGYSNNLVVPAKNNSGSIKRSLDIEHCWEISKYFKPLTSNLFTPILRLLDEHRSVLFLTGCERARAGATQRRANTDGSGARMSESCCSAAWSRDDPTVSLAYTVYPNKRNL